MGVFCHFDQITTQKICLVLSVQVAFDDFSLKQHSDILAQLSQYMTPMCHNYGTYPAVLKIQIMKKL